MEGLRMPSDGAERVWDRYENILLQTEPMRYEGTVRTVAGLLVEGCGPRGRVGDLCHIFVRPEDSRPVKAEITGFKGGATLLMAYGDLHGIEPGCRIKGTGVPLSVNVSEELLGRVVDATATPIDGGPRVISRHNRPVFGEPVPVLRRRPIDRPLATGVRAIDACLTLGRGQRVGIFAGSGVGKSTLLGMIARNTEADVTVLALVGERGREVREFIERDLGPEGLRRSVVVVATADDTPLAKIRAAYVATTIAEHFRDEGRDVLLMMDSVTRFARAQREIGLANGEPPGLGGFPPSVVATLSKVLERAGTSDRGSITGIYTVLVEGDDLNDPVSDAVRGILDGHIVLSRELAEMNHYPAVDVLASVSRLMNRVADGEHRRWAGRLRELLAVYRDARDLVRYGAYVSGSDPKVDEALALVDRINAFLRQDIEERSSFAETLAGLEGLFRGSGKSGSDDTSKRSVPERFGDLLERMSDGAV